MPARATGIRQTLERLLDLYLGAGNDRRTAELAAQLEQIHHQRTGTVNTERFAELRQRFQKVAGITVEELPAAPPASAHVPTPAVDPTPVVEAAFSGTRQSKRGTGHGECSWSDESYRSQRRNSKSHDEQRSSQNRRRQTFLKQSSRRSSQKHPLKQFRRQPQPIGCLYPRTGKKWTSRTNGKPSCRKWHRARSRSAAAPPQRSRAGSPGSLCTPKQSSGRRSVSKIEVPPDEIAPVGS